MHLDKPHVIDQRFLNVKKLGEVGKISDFILKTFNQKSIGKDFVFYSHAETSGAVLISLLKKFINLNRIFFEVNTANSYYNFLWKAMITPSLFSDLMNEFDKTMNLERCSYLCEGLKKQALSEPELAFIPFFTNKVMLNGEPLGGWEQDRRLQLTSRWQPNALTRNLKSIRDLIANFSKHNEFTVNPLCSPSVNYENEDVNENEYALHYIDIDSPNFPEIDPVLLPDRNFEWNDNIKIAYLESYWLCRSTMFYYRRKNFICKVSNDDHIQHFKKYNLEYNLIKNIENTDNIEQSEELHEKDTYLFYSV